MVDFKIDRQNKTFVYDDGEVIPIPKKDQREVLRTKHARGLEKGEKEFLGRTGAKNMAVPTLSAFKESAEQGFLGNPVAQGINYAKSGYQALSPGEGQENLSFLDRVKDNFYAYQDAKKKHLGEQAQEYPTASALGTGAGMVGELAALRKLPAAAQLPIMGAAHSETSFLDPIQKGKEVGKDALIGYTLDKFFGGLNKVATARGERKAAQGAINTANEANTAETLRAAQANEAEGTRFATETSARDAEMAALPGRQAAENQAFSNSTSQRVDKVSKILGKTPIEATALGVEEFVEETIGRSPLAGSAEGNWASRLVKSLFKGDKKGKISGETLKKGIQSLDEAIASKEGAVKQILLDFRSGLIDTLPQKATNSYVYEKWGNKLYNNLTTGTGNTLNLAIEAAPEINAKLATSLGENYTQNLNQSMHKSIREVLENHKWNLAEAIENGTIQVEIEQAVLNNPAYAKMKNKLDNLYTGYDKATAQYIFPEYKALERTFIEYPQKIIDKMSKTIKNDLPRIKQDQYVKAMEIENAVSPIPRTPNTLPQPAPVAPAQTISPNLQTVPEMQPGRGMYGRLAQGLEAVQGMGYRDVSSAARNFGTAGAVSSLAGLPVTKSAAALASGAKAAEYATRPGALPNAVRATFKQGGIQAIEQWAQQYPSYHDGILDNPLERRSLTKQIEESQDMPIEVKAVTQSKVNRGIPISGKL